MKIGVAAIKGTFEGKVRLFDLEPPTRYRMALEGSGGPGFVRGEAGMELSDADGGTRVGYSADVQVGGLIASVGQRMLDAPFLGLAVWISTTRLHPILAAQRALMHEGTSFVHRVPPAERRETFTSPTSLRQACHDAPMTVGYSGKPLVTKIGIKPRERWILVSAPKGFEAALEPLPEGAALVRTARSGVDGAIFFPPSRAHLARSVARVQEGIAQGGALWISWPKKSSGVATDLTEDVLREVVLPTGWVDVKVCAVDETYSGLKFLRRKT